MPLFTEDMTAAEVLEVIRSKPGIAGVREVGPSYLQYKLYEEFQRGQLRRTTWLVIGTCVMALGTWGLFVVTLIASGILKSN